MEIRDGIRLVPIDCNDYNNSNTSVVREEKFNYNAPHYFEVKRKYDGVTVGRIHFQEGPIKDAGINGVTEEQLICMVIERLESFQNSNFNCECNHMAILRLQQALDCFKRRKDERTKRGVEGTYRV